jgi:hypothetical protein
LHPAGAMKHLKFANKTYPEKGLEEQKEK